MWPVALSGRLPVVALVGHYPTNKLIGREPIPDRKTFHHPTCVRWSYPVLDPVSQAYPEIRGRLLTCYSPVRHSSTNSKLSASAFDLHVLSTQPAFVLSQDQTLHKKLYVTNESQQDSRSSRGDRPAHQKISRPNTLTPQNGWRFGEEPPTRGEILFDQVIVLPENNKCSGITTCSNKHAIGFSNHKHTPITTTRKNERVHWGYQFHFLVTHPIA